MGSTLKGPQDRPVNDKKEEFEEGAISLMPMLLFALDEMKRSRPSW